MRLVLVRLLLSWDTVACTRTQERLCSILPFFCRTEDAVGHRWMSVLHAKSERIKLTLTEEDWKFLQCANDIPYRNVKPWTIDEDEKLVRLALETGGNNWSAVSKELSGRSSRQCRDRYNSKLDPNISKEPWTDEEDRRIAVAQSKFGNQWVKISKYLVGRPEMAVKVRWYTILSQKADKLMQELTDDDYRFAQVPSPPEGAKLPHAPVSNPSLHLHECLES